jgi:hypothetical protein
LRVHRLRLRSLALRVLSPASHQVLSRLLAQRLATGAHMSRAGGKQSALIYAQGRRWGMSSTRMPWYLAPAVVDECGALTPELLALLDRPRAIATALITGDWRAPEPQRFPFLERGSVLWLIRNGWRRVESPPDSGWATWHWEKPEGGTPPRFRRLDSSCSAVLILCAGRGICNTL